MQYAYEMSIREVLPKLRVELMELENFSCCGLPMKSVNAYASLYLAIRNLAIAEDTDQRNLLVPCTGCHLSFSEAVHFWKEDDGLREKLGSLLAEEGLKYCGTIRIWHLIDLLHDAIEKETIQGSVKKRLDGRRAHPVEGGVRDRALPCPGRPGHPGQGRIEEVRPCSTPP